MRALAEYHYAQDELALENLQNAIESYKRVEREDNSNAYCYNLSRCLILAAQKGDEQTRVWSKQSGISKAVELNRLMSTLLGNASKTRTYTLLQNYLKGAQSLRREKRHSFLSSDRDSDSTCCGLAIDMRAYFEISEQTLLCKDF